jgi:AcrR family transcriptional regulator
MGRTREASEARQRLLETADRLFYRDGIRAVGIDRIIAEAGVAKMSLYKHFPSKDDLILAYLDRRAQQGRAAVQDLIARYPGDPRGALHAWAVAFTEDGVVDEYRGCTFINAAAEYGQPDHPVRAAAVAMRRWVCDTKEALLREAGHPEPAAAARTLLALRTGYLISASLEEDEGWAGEFIAACDRVVGER